MMKNKSLKSAAGFTLVEIAVIAPIVVLVITGILVVLINFISSNAVTSSRLSLSNEVHGSLSDMENKLSPAQSFVSSVDSGLNLQNANSSDYSSRPHLIGITTDEVGTGSNVTPALADCNQPLSEDNLRPTATIYFVDSSNNLKRRILTQASTPCGGASVNPDNCRAANTTSNCAEDTILATNVTDMTIKYCIDDTCTTGNSPADADSADVSITTSKNVAGKSLSASDSLHVSLLGKFPPPPQDDGGDGGGGGDDGGDGGGGGGPQLALNANPDTLSMSTNYGSYNWPLTSTLTVSNGTPPYDYEITPIAGEEDMLGLTLVDQSYDGCVAYTDSSGYEYVGVETNNCYSGLFGNGGGGSTTCPTNSTGHTDQQVTGTSSGTVWGTDIYTNDSNVGKAAVHAGLLSIGQTDTIRVCALPGQSSYTGSTRNGITTLSYGSWGGSMSLISLSGGGGGGSGDAILGVFDSQPSTYQYNACYTTNLITQPSAFRLTVTDSNSQQASTIIKIYCDYWGNYNYNTDICLWYGPPICPN